MGRPNDRPGTWFEPEGPMRMLLAHDRAQYRIPADQSSRGHRADESAVVVELSHCCNELAHVLLDRQMQDHTTWNW